MVREDVNQIAIPSQPRRFHTGDILSLRANPAIEAAMSALTELRPSMGEQGKAALSRDTPARR